MSKSLALLTIHGMGDTPRDYYAELHDRVKKAVGKTVWNKVIFMPLYFQDVLQGSQSGVFNRMREYIDWMSLRKFMLYGFSDAASLEYTKEVKHSPYHRTQEKILQAMDDVFDVSGENAIPVIIVAQSLGCQVMSSYIWDAQRPNPSAGVWKYPKNDGATPGSPRDLFRRMKTVQRFFTTGCNIPIFVAGHSNIVAIDPPNTRFKWYNFYDEDDVLGWPLKPLSDSYNQIVEDIEVNAGSRGILSLVKSLTPLSHEQYWKDSYIIDRIAGDVTFLA